LWKDLGLLFLPESTTTGSGHKNSSSISALKVAKRLDEFSNNPGEVPKPLQAIITQLPLLLNALGRIKSDAQMQNLNLDTKGILRAMVPGCQAQIVEVEKMINEITSMPGDSFKVKIKKVFTSLKYDEKVWRWRGICTHIYWC
jgi:hypothetical protein